MSFRTAIVPAAGLGTRFLPTTKSVPKELLPVIDTPAIELVADEAARAGADRMVIVISPGKEAVVDHFRPAPELEATLAERGKEALLAAVRRAPELIAVETAIQEEPLGLGHAVACAEPNLREDDDAVAVILPDDIVPEGTLDRMIKVRARYGGSVMLGYYFPPEKVSAYGVFEMEDTDDDGVKRVHGMVEKPRPEEAPSTLASVGRYLLDRAVFEALGRITPGAGGELQLTDAVALMIAEGHPVHVVVQGGVRRDLGNPAGFLKVAVDFALQHPEYGPDLHEWLRNQLR